MATDALRPRIPVAQLPAYDRSTRSMTPSLHRLRYGGIAPIEKLTNEATALASIAERAGIAWKSIHATHWSSMLDETATAGGRLTRSAKHARALMDGLRSDFDQAMTQTEARLSALQDKLNKASAPPTSMGEALADSEARALIRAQTNPDKALSIAKAHPRAVASVSPQVAGIAPEVHASIRADYLRSVAPDDVAAYHDLKAAFAAANDAIDNLDKDASGLIDFDSADRIAAGAAWQPTPEAA